MLDMCAAQMTDMSTLKEARQGKGLRLRQLFWAAGKTVERFFD
jgi:hypothetical protein